MIQKKTRTAVLVVLVLLVGLAAYADTVTVSTYYPSPYGSYQNLDTTGETHLATGGSGVSIGKATAPGSQLDVKGPGTGEILIGQWPTDTRYAGLGLANSMGAGTYNILSSPTDTHLYINRPAGRGIYFRENNVDQMILQPGGLLQVAGNIIAAAPTAANHLATKAYVDAAGGGPDGWSCTIRSNVTNNTDIPVEVLCSGSEKMINGYCVGGTSSARYPLSGGQGLRCGCPSGCGPGNSGWAYANCCS